MGKDRVGKKMPKHIGSTADEQRLAVLLDEFNCLSSTTDQLDMSPPSMSMISTQATIAGLLYFAVEHFKRVPSLVVKELSHQCHRYA